MTWREIKDLPLYKLRLHIHQYCSSLSVLVESTPFIEKTWKGAVNPNTEEALEELLLLWRIDSSESFSIDVLTFPPSLLEDCKSYSENLV